MSGDRPARWRWVGWSVGAALLVAAAAVLTVTVDVHGRNGSASCGSAWDVVAGRSGWQEWWAMDQADPVTGAPRLRTDGCVGAVNAHVVSAALLAAGALAGLTVAALLARRRTAGRWVGPARRLRNLGTAVTVLGAVLCLGGLAGLAVLVADPNASLFLYVDRSVVVLLGLLLLIPAVLLIVLGRGATVLAEHLNSEGVPDEEAADESP